MSTQRDEFINKLKAQIDELNAQMSEFESKAEVVGDQAVSEFDAQMDKLREQAKEMQLKMGELQASSEDTWDRMLEETRKVRDAFIHSVNYFKSQMKK